MIHTLPVNESADGASSASPIIQKRPRKRQFFWWIAAIGLTGAVFGAAWYSGGDRFANEPLHPAWNHPIAVPDFSLTERDGRTVSLADLRGKVWVANFIYAQCPGPCPMLSARLRSVQMALADQASEVVLVSFSLDPISDTPAVLADYARRFHADANWWFLTNRDVDAMRHLVETGFLQSVVPASGDNPMIHSNYFAVLDRRARIRAFHDGLDPDVKARVVRDVYRLLAEPAAP